MWNDFLSLLRNTIKQNLMPIVTGLQYWRDRSFVRTKFLSVMKKLLSGMLDVSPRSAGDYYGIMRLLVSRRLVHRIILLSGCLCLGYLLWRSPADDLGKGSGAGRTFSCTSIPLRFYEGEVQIRAKAGYIAYRGAVSGGYASGEGTLFDENETVIYRGGFEKSRFQGEGTLYYDTGGVQYEGTFQENLFQGTGKLYRESGSKLYEGEFVKGMREGTGLLFDESEKEIFAGTFHRDEPVYAQLLGKTPTETADLYKGERILYQYDGQFLTVLPDIGAACLAASTEDSLRGETVTETVYVEKDSIVSGRETITDLEGLKKAWGEPAFAGNSHLTFAEAVEAQRLQKKGKEIGIVPGLAAELLYEELYRVERYDRNALVYLTVFDRDGLIYTFVSEDAKGDFFLYLIE